MVLWIYYFDIINIIILSRVFCLVGDGESAEGSIWESLHFSSYYKLDNLCVIFDINRLGQSEPTSLGHDIDTYRKRLESFGYNAIAVDGHDIDELVKAFHVAANTKGKPTALIAKTFKGKNFPKIEDLENWHGKPLGDQSERVLKHLQGLITNTGPLQIHPQKPLKDDAPIVDITNIKLASPPNYKLGETVATRVAYGTGLVKIAQDNSRVIALDGDMKNSTFADALKKFDPNRYIECFIAEQNLVGTAIGAACRDRTVAFVSTFATFLTRAYDQVLYLYIFFDITTKKNCFRFVWVQFRKVMSILSVHIVALVLARMDPVKWV